MTQLKFKQKQGAYAIHISNPMGPGARLLLIMKIELENIFKENDLENIFKVAAIYPTAALLPHSCSPNTRAVYRRSGHKYFHSVDYKKKSLIIIILSG